MHSRTWLPTLLLLALWCVTGEVTFEAEVPTLSLSEDDLDAERGVATILLSFEREGQALDLFATSDSDRVIFESNKRYTSNVDQKDYVMKIPFEVTAASNDVADGDATATIKLRVIPSDMLNGEVTDAASHKPYLEAKPVEVEVNIKDDDVASVVVSQQELTLLSDAQDGVAFTVSLGSRPASAVTLALQPVAPLGFSVDKKTVTLAPNDWRAGATVVLKPKQQSKTDAPHELHLLSVVASSDDAAYEHAGHQQRLAVEYTDTAAKFTLRFLGLTTAPLAVAASASALKGALMSLRPALEIGVASVLLEEADAQCGEGCLRRSWLVQFQSSGDFPLISLDAAAGSTGLVFTTETERSGSPAWTVFPSRRELAPSYLVVDVVDAAQLQNAPPNAGNDGGQTASPEALAKMTRCVGVRVPCEGGENVGAAGELMGVGGREECFECAAD